MARDISHAIDNNEWLGRPATGRVARRRSEFQFVGFLFGRSSRWYSFRFCSAGFPDLVGPVFGGLISLRARYWSFVNNARG